MDDQRTHLRNRQARLGVADAREGELSPPRTTTGLPSGQHSFDSVWWHDPRRIAIPHALLVAVVMPDAYWRSHRRRRAPLASLSRAAFSVFGWTQNNRATLEAGRSSRSIFSASLIWAPVNPGETVPMEVAQFLGE